MISEKKSTTFPALVRCMSVTKFPVKTFWFIELKPGKSVVAKVPEDSVLTVTLAALSGQGTGSSVVKVSYLVVVVVVGVVVVVVS
jgi:hypothetical protein